MPTRANDRKLPAWLVITVLCLSGTVVALQQTLVVPLLPDFPEIFDTSVTNISWLVTATLLTGAVATPIVSRLADMFGKRLMMLVCLSAMVSGSLLAAIGATLPLVIAGRSLQGFASALIPVGISILRDELPRERVNSAVALMSATLGIGAGVGLPLSGLIYAHLGWEAIFWFSAGAGVTLIIAVLIVVPESPLTTRGSFDYVGAVLLSGALVSLLLAITKGSSWGWTSEPTILLFIAAAVLLAFWAPFELHVGQPLVDIRTSSRRPVLLTNIASIAVGFSMYCNSLSSTQQLQMPKISGYGFGLSVASAGLCMLPSALAMALFSPASAVITRRWGARITLIVGALALAFGYISRVFLTAEVWQVILGSSIVGIGTAIAYAAMPTLIMRSVPITETASANGLNTLLRAVGTSTASAVVAVTLSSVVATHAGVTLPSLDAFKRIFWFAALAALVAAAVALAIPRRTVTPPVPGAAVPEPSQLVSEDLVGEGHDEEIIVRGLVLHRDATPIRQAVVSVMGVGGRPVDWSRTDNEGVYSVVLPGPGRYVLVSSADGWAPTSEVVEFTDATSQHHTRLRDRLSLSGVVTSGGIAVPHARVWVTRPSGESTASTQSDADGRYELALPPTGRYVLTALDPARDRTRSRQIIVAAQSARIDIDIAIDIDRDLGHRPGAAVPAVGIGVTRDP